MDWTARASRLRLMAFDVDGVMTDGRLYFGSAGDEMKTFSSRDGHGLKMLQAGGVRLAIITGRTSRAVEARAANLGIDLLHQGVEDKREVMLRLLDQIGLSAQEAGYMGDDVVDLTVMRTCGFAATVQDAHPLVLRHAHWVARQPAGGGAVRELCEAILAAQGRLDAALARYLS
jgi:3-deoxy-D-manno-octulosonate 8-phosphate phosphatase (KDO 8-P phosphatase)